jgi:hypothetical protein
MIDHCTSLLFRPRKVGVFTSSLVLRLLGAQRNIDIDSPPTDARIRLD